MDHQSQHHSEDMGALNFNGEKASEIVHDLVVYAQKNDSILVSDIVKALDRRAFGLGILIFALPNCLPIPSIPGFSALTSLPMFFFAVQMFLGFEKCWLPAFLGKRSFPLAKIASALKTSIPYIVKAEGYLKPRFAFVTDKNGLRVVAIFLFIFLAVLALPIPFGNLLPGVCICLIALGIMQKDGLATACGMVMGLGAIYLVLQIAKSFLAWLMVFA